jgi:hypothetical protein
MKTYAEDLDEILDIARDLGEAEAAGGASYGARNDCPRPGTA